MSLPTRTSVLIIGAGPVGLTLANLLGSESVATVLVERNPGCVSEPRAVALDGESLRTLQAVGLTETVLGNIRQGFVADYLNGDGGRSSVRQGLGVAMTGERLPQQWLVIDTVDTHLGDEPACRFYCDPQRPAMTIIRPGAERRWEWMLVGDERGEDMLEDGRIRELLAQHTDPAAAAARDAVFAALNTDPAAAADFGASTVAPLSDVRLPRGWFLQDGSGGRMLPQPLVPGGDGDVLLDELLGPGFSALLHGAAAVPVGVASHPLWRALAPTLYAPGHCGNELPLAGFLQSAEPAITLVRPDRFVLAQMPLTTGATATLDSLQAMLEH